MGTKMKKLKCPLALLLALLLSVSVCISKDTNAFASVTEENLKTQMQESAKTEEEPIEAGVKEEEHVEAYIDTKEEEFTEEYAETEKEESAEDYIEAVAEESVEASAEDGEEKNVETVNETEEAIKTENKSAEVDFETEENIMVMSMFPLEEVNAYLTLTGYSKEDLENFSVTKLLSMLKDKNGSTVEIASTATTVWKYVKDDDDSVEKYDTYAISDNETINLYPGESVSAFQFEIIVGSDGQLNRSNKRYIIRAYLTDDFEDEIEVEMYIQADDSTRKEAVPDSCNVWTSEYSDGTEELNFDFSFGGSLGESLADQGSVWLNIRSELVNNPRVNIEVYPVIVYGSYYITVKTPLADQILNQSMENVGAGYQISGERNSDVTFQMVTYVDGEVYSTKYIGVRYWNWYPAHEGTIYTIQDDVRENVFSNMESQFDFGRHVTTLTFELGQGFDVNNEYYFDYDFVQQKNYGDGAKTNYDNYVTKVVLGHYDSLEEAEAAGATDVSNDIVCNGRFPSGKGYLANYSGGINFTVFKVARLSQSFPIPYDTLADKITVKVIENTSVWREFTDDSIIGEPDPWFRVTGATNITGEFLDTYVIENGKNINIDTMYGYGYQTVFINDDVNDFIPVFERANDNAITVNKIYVNGEEFEAGTVISFAEDSNVLTARFAVTITDSKGDHTKNYYVTFAKKGTGAQLYVAGPLAPDVRSVFLNEYFENKHDIFIANIGDEPLTNLWIDLDATNVKLDDYWTIGGEGNNILAACPDNFTTELMSTDYGEMSNVAKIRLVPPDDGKGGEINGTLKIYSGEENNPEKSELLATIILSEKAQNPEIVTTNVKDGVLYVPYSYLVSTNNMYDWTSVEFTLTGELPDGIEFIQSTGEIYGIPLETGEFPISVTATFKSDTYSFNSSTVDLILTVKENTNVNVYNETDDGYNIEQAIGTDVGGYDFVLEDYRDEIFWSQGELNQFVDLWLNGERLEENVDYIAEDGSTKITIYKQTFDNIKNKNGINTLAAEFRTSDATGKNDVNNTNGLKRTAQNFRLNISEGEPAITPQPTTTPGFENSGSTQKPTTTPGSGNGIDQGTNTASSAKPNNNSVNTSSNGNASGVSSISENEADYVTLSVNVVDADDKPMANTNLEIHSTPQNAVTNANGTARFANVEFGPHTVTVKDANGNTIASKNFEIVSGALLSLDGEKITAKKGSDFVLKVKVNNNELEFVSVELVSPQTGDISNVSLWMTLLSVSVFVLLIYTIYRKKMHAK